MERERPQKMERSAPVEQNSPLDDALGCRDGDRDGECPSCVVPNRFTRSPPTAPTCPHSLDASVTVPPGPVVYEGVESNLPVSERAMTVRSDADGRSWQRFPGRFDRSHKLTSCGSVAVEC